MPDTKKDAPAPIDPTNPPFTPPAPPEDQKPKLSPAKTAKQEREVAIANAWNSRSNRPIDITTLDADDASERIRTAEKADVLTFWRKLARLSEDAEAGEALIEAINARLLQVQGPPLPPED